jgi:pyridoxine kinase
MEAAQAIPCVCMSELSGPKTILSIQSQVVSARVGNSVAAFAIERLGVKALVLPTTILGRRPDLGVPGGGPVSPETFAALIEGLSGDGRLGEIDAVLSGYLGDAEQAPLILDLVERVKAANPKAIYVCDPVLGDDGALFVGNDIADAVINGLWRQADWLAPNAFELGLITGRAIDGLDAARNAARRIGKPMLVSSVRTANGIGNLYAAPGGDRFCETTRLPHAPKGAGDLLTALFTARRVRGETPAFALEGATGATFDVIVRSLATESEDLALPYAQDVLGEPVTWPTSRQLEIV